MDLRKWNLSTILLRRYRTGSPGYAIKIFSIFLQKDSIPLFHSLFFTGRPHPQFSRYWGKSPQIPLQGILRLVALIQRGA